MADAREQFERWYVGALVTQGAREIERDGQGHYILMQTRLAWQAWHAGWLERTAGVMGADAPQEFFCNKCGYFGPVQVFHERPNGSGKCDYMAVPMKASESRCKVPPQGWSCSREPGHEGPCAARPDGVAIPLEGKAE